MNLAKPTTRALKRINRSNALKKIYFEGPITRLELSKLTDLSPATVTNVVGELLSEAIVVESGSEESDGGRPRALIAINPAYGYFIGVDAGETRIEIELFDLTLHNLQTISIPLSLEENEPQQVVDHIVDGVQDLLAGSGVPRDRVMGVGIGVPGLVEPTAGVSIFAPNWGWHDVPLQALLKERLDLSLHLDNGAKAMALAEMWFGAGRGIEDLAVLLIGTGVGAGIIASGTLYRGSANSAGEWGHTVIELNGRECRCGSRGCIEAYVGATGIIRRLRDRNPQSEILHNGDQMATLAAMVTAARQGDDAAIQVLRETAHYLGAGVANLINLFNPQMIVLGGWAGLQIGDYILPELHEFVERYALKQPLSRTKVGLCQLDQEAITMGAAALALEPFLESAGVPKSRILAHA